MVIRFVLLFLDYIIIYYIALSKQIIVKETFKELNAILKNASPLLGPRIRVLIEIKSK